MTSKKSSMSLDLSILGMEYIRQSSWTQRRTENWMVKQEMFVWREEAERQEKRAGAELGRYWKVLNNARRKMTSWRMAYRRGRLHREAQTGQFYTAATNKSSKARIRRMDRAGPSARGWGPFMVSHLRGSMMSLCWQAWNKEQVQKKKAKNWDWAQSSYCFPVSWLHWSRES